MSGGRDSRQGREGTVPLGAVQGRGPPGEPPLPPCAALGLGGRAGPGSPPAVRGPSRVWIPGGGLGRRDRPGGRDP